MESHQFSSGPPPKPKNTVLYVVIGILAVLGLCCGGFVFLGFFAMNKTKSLIGCVMHYQVAYQAVKEYAKDHKGNLPPAKNWQDSIVSYYKIKDNSGSSFLSFGDPKGDLGCKSEDGKTATGIAYNSSIAGKNFEKLSETEDPILFFEILKTGRNLAESYKQPAGVSPIKVFGQPRPWMTVDLHGNSSNGSSSQSFKFGN